MRVWRIAHSVAINPESKTFAGPYQCSPLRDSGKEVLEVANKLCSAHANEQHPSPQWDMSLGFIRDEEVCGFDSVEAMESWFEGFLGDLADAGFMIFEYEVRECRVGKHGQTLFEVAEAELISVVEINAS